MSAETLLRAGLVAHAPLLALVAQRIYPDAIPEDQPLPAVVYVRSNTERIRSTSGRSFGEWVDVSVQCWAETRSIADAVADAVIAAVDAMEQDVTDRSAMADLDIGIHGVSLAIRMLV